MLYTKIWCTRLHFSAMLYTKFWCTRLHLHFYHYFYYSLTGDCFEKIQKQSRLVRHDISCAKCNDIALKEKGAPLPWKTMLIKIVL